MTNEQQPSPESIQGMVDAIAFQRDRANNELANCAGQLADLKAKLACSEKEIAELKLKFKLEKTK